MKLKDIEFGVCGHRKIIDDKTEVRIVINAYTKRVYMSYVIRNGVLEEGYCPGFETEQIVTHGPLLYECMPVGALCDGDLEVEY